MKTYLTMLAKTLALAIATIAIFTLSQGVARADEVTIAGSTQPTGGFTGTTPGLTFVGNTFNVTTQSGFAALSGVERLGTFNQLVNQGDLSGNFTLTVTFTLPSGITGGNPTTFTAAVTGHVGDLDHGGALITFDTPSQKFNFSNAGATGTFTLTLPNFVPVTSGHTAELQAFITSARQSSVPEPATLLLLGTGLTGVAGVARRRMKRGRS